MLRIRTAPRGAVELLRALDPMAAEGSDRAGEIAHWVLADRCLVALQDETIVGYAAWSFGFFHQRFIELVMVGEAYRRRGVGRALVQHVLELAPNEKLWTSTNQSNAPMRELLAGLGFVLSGRVDNLDPGDPELIFVHLPGA